MKGAMYKFFGFNFFSTSAFSRAPPHKWIKAIKKSLAKTEKSVLIEIENTSELFSFLLHFRCVANGLSCPLPPFVFILRCCRAQYFSACYCLLATYLCTHRRMSGRSSVIERDRECGEYSVPRRCLFQSHAFFAWLSFSFSIFLSFDVSLSSTLSLSNGNEIIRSIERDRR